MRPPADYDVLIVGAGHGGAQAAIALRQLGFAGSIAMLGAEPDLPYERPPLSKDYLAGEKDFERILIRPGGFWAERGVEMLLGLPVVSVDADAHRVMLADGTDYGYGSLIWAAGGAPRRLACPGGDLGGVHTVRSRADVDALVAELPQIRRVAVIGGGYIGLEAAAALRKLGKEVLLLEALDRVLARVAGPPVSAFYEAEHRTQGVDLRTGVAVDAILGEDRVTGIRLGSGELVEAEAAIIGIGIAPAVGALLEAGATGGDGVHVDAHCRTTLPDIYAVGDCAAQESPFAGGRRVRIESVQNAHDQAATAAKAITGLLEPYGAVPWFWSNQYDLKLQTVGLSAGYDDLVIRGDPATRSFSTVYLREGRVLALDCVNAVKDYVQGRQLILNAAPVRARLADSAIPLKELAPSA